MPKQPIEHKDLVELLSILKEETPEYPTDMIRTRKVSFLKQGLDIRVSGADNGGGTSGAGGSSGMSGSGGSSGSGAATIGFGISLKSALTFAAIFVLLTSTYVFRERIVSFLDENNIINIEETASPLIASTTDDQPTESAMENTSPYIAESATESTPGFEDNYTPGHDNNGDNSNARTGTPEPDTIQVTPTPTNSDQSGPASVFRYLVCILRNGGGNCK